MPCSDSGRYDSGPNKRAERTIEVARHICYVAKCQGKKVKLLHIRVSKSSPYDQNIDIHLDSLTAELCGKIRSMSEREREEIVFNGHSREARALADWWEDHEKFDKEREVK